MGKIAKEPRIRIALLENDPLRVVGFGALFESESGFELVPASLPELTELQILTWLLGNRNTHNFFDTLDGHRKIEVEARSSDPVVMARLWPERRRNLPHG